MTRVCIALLIIINQSIIVWTLKTKSLLPSLYSSRKRWRSGQKGGITPLWQRGAGGDFLKHMSSLLWTP